MMVVMVVVMNPLVSCYRDIDTDVSRRLSGSVVLGLTLDCGVHGALGYHMVFISAAFSVWAGNRDPRNY